MARPRKDQQEKALNELTKEAEALGINTEDEIEYDLKTYVPVWNDTFKRYDMLTVYINSGSEQTKITREATRYDSEHRAHADVIKRLTDDFMKKGSRR